MIKLVTLIALMGSLAMVSPAEAQQRENDKDRKEAEIPKSHRPPPGMCRVWLDDVPPGQQPASTDCKSALRNKPAKARVIFGDDYVDNDKKRSPSLTGFTEVEKQDKDASKRVPWRKP
ncbi:MAG: hypothetical protein H0X64_09100 [Gemmatimonadaceae bacterium]|nr:hypothetical protein [Gemmatimonadaceae bacterium]